MSAIKAVFVNQFKVKFLLIVLTLIGSVVSFNAHATYYYSGGRGACFSTSIQFGSEKGAASAAAEPCYGFDYSATGITVTRTITSVTLYLPRDQSRGSSIWEVTANRHVDYANTTAGDGDYVDIGYLYVSKKYNSITTIALGDFPQGEFSPVRNQPKAKTCNPIHIITGNKYKRAVDFPMDRLTSLSFQRYYNSHDPRSTEFGYGWRHSFQSSVETSYEGKIATVNRPDGASVEFSNFIGAG